MGASILTNLYLKEYSMTIFEFGIPLPDDKAKIKNEWKIIARYDYEIVYFTDGTSAFTSDVEAVELILPRQGS